MYAVELRPGIVADRAEEVSVARDSVLAGGVQVDEWYAVLFRLACLGDVVRVFGSYLVFENNLFMLFPVIILRC